ncbi:MAG: hypothetical protein NTX42_07820 [Methanothrix sp.]|nr:hypothetical protein [Methanothrix sp.]
MWAGLEQTSETKMLESFAEEGLLGAAARLHQYVGFKRIEQGMDIGVDLGEVWGTAERCEESS